VIFFISHSHYSENIDGAALTKCRALVRAMVLDGLERLASEGRLTEGGEALAPAEHRWFAMWTQSHCEQLVHDQLAAKGYEVFLPTIREWSRRAGVRRLIPVPMFSGYLFLHHEIDKRSYVDVMGVRGVVRILGERWDRLAPVDDAEIEAIQRLQRSDVALMPYPYLRDGQRVRIVEGSLAGVEGILVRRKANHDLLVLSINLLNRSVAVEVNCGAVIPVDSATPARRFQEAAGLAATECY
jgi:transcription antitermination factor NusG